MSIGQPVRVKTPLGKDLLFRSMHMSEELGRLFHCELELMSPKEDIALDALLGRDVTVEIDLANGGKRYVHGFVSDMVQTGRHGDHATYTAHVRPWLWFLSRTADCRIFQEMKVPDIVKEIFRENGFSDFKDLLSGKYRLWEYCVQYRETDFNFVSRLMEQEGIYYFFEHEDGKDTLVLADADSAHTRIAGYESIPYYPPSQNVVRDEHIYDWQLSRSVRTGAYALNAYHFKKPRANLEVRSSISRGHAMADYEFFDYPGEYFEIAEGEAYVGARMQELQARYERVHGQTDAMGLFPGGLFELTEYPRRDQNREYLLVAVHHDLSLDDYRSGASSDRGLAYTCSFEALDSREAFRAERITPKPGVQGPQTAIVTGPSGEEIHTDEYGRVKVQFKWDRYGKSDENSSCWVRVAQVWAGSQWGGMTIPRVGQEVVVDFIEGDPDRPIVTGRVYNADNMPPYALPANKTQSGLKSRSSKQGTAENFNEIRFEDKKGSEQMLIHAEKDQNVVVENTQTIKVGFDKSQPGDRNESVFNDRTLQVGRDKSETIMRNKSVQVTGNHGEGIGGNMTISVAKNLTETVAINYAETVGAAMELTVGGALAETVGANKIQTIGNNSSANISRDLTVNVGKNMTEKVGGNYAGEVKKDVAIKVGGLARATVEKEYSVNAKKIQLVAQDEITIMTGKAEISMKKNGDITIKGKKINVKGSGDVTVKGSKIKEN